MKSFIAVATLAFAGVASAATCSSSQQTSAYTTLASLLTLDSFQGCVDDSGYSLLYSTSLPSDAEYVKMCASSNCNSLLSSVKSLNPPDCTLTVPTSGLQLNVYELANGFSGVCAGLSTDAPATTTSAPSTTDAPSATTAAPSTSGAPSATTAAPSATSATAPTAC